jgi:hypothetical protein
VGWEPVVQAYNNRMLVVPANLKTKKGDLLYVASELAEAIQRSSPIWRLLSKADFCQHESQQF